MRTTKTKTLVECALMIALAFILGYIPIFELPQGGSITACSMMPLVVASFRHGPKWGLLTGFIFSLIQMMLGFENVLYCTTFGAMLLCILLDYVVAYTLVFFCGFAAGRKLGWLWGTILAGVGRWLSLTLSGALLWYMYMPEEFLGMPMVNPWVYSALLNGLLIVLVTAVNLVTLGAMNAMPSLRAKLMARQY